MGVSGCVEGTRGEDLVAKVSKTFLPWPTPPRKHPHVANRECEKQTSKTNAVLRLPEKQKQNCRSRGLQGARIKSRGSGSPRCFALFRIAGPKKKEARFWGSPRSSSVPPQGAKKKNGRSKKRKRYPSIPQKNKKKKTECLRNTPEDQKHTLEDKR